MEKNNQTKNVDHWLSMAEKDVFSIRHPQPGYLIAQGGSRADLLQRMSTNDLSNFEAGNVRETVFTNAIGRMIDLVTILNSKEQFHLLTSPGKAESMKNWLERHVFFQDDFRLILPEPTWQFWGVYGPSAASRIESEFPGAAELGAGQLLETGPGFVWRVETPLPGLRMLLNPEASMRIFSSLPEQSASDEVRRAYEILRIRAGFSAPGSEIREEYIPLEAGLWDAVSFQKGCYVGQEIIARLESRGRLARKLVGIDLDLAIPNGTQLYQGKRKVGELTSSIQSPEGNWFGLAITKPDAVEQDGGRVRTEEHSSAGKIYAIEPRRG
jgi:tRNA-modifying protein YgfZ